MNRLKAWFVSGAGTLALGLSVHAGYMLATTDASLTWGGALLATAAFNLQMAIILSRISPRTSANLPVTMGTAALGLALTVAGSFVEGASIMAITYAVLGVAMMALYVFWYSRLGRGHSEALVEGSRLPALSFEDASGNAITTEELRAGGPLLLMFYRGNWCPLCNAQIRELAERYRELKERGVTVAFISPQSHENTKSIAARFDVPAHFLVDVEHRSAKRLGIVHAGGLPAGMDALGYEQDTVYPTVVITDQDGVILFSDETDNYRVRPEPDMFIAVLDGKDPRTAAPAAPAAAPAT